MPACAPNCTRRVPWRSRSRSGVNSMDIEANDTELVARLRRLDAGSASATPGFDYQGMLDRHASRKARAHRRQAYARGTAAALVVALIGASLWRLDNPKDVTPLRDD